MNTEEQARDAIEQLLTRAHLEGWTYRRTAKAILADVLPSNPAPEAGDAPAEAAMRRMVERAQASGTYDEYRPAATREHGDAVEGAGAMSITLHFDGKKNPEMRAYVETLPDEPIDAMWADKFKAYRKTGLTYAARIRVPFTVDTLEGVHSAKAGDYLAIGVHGEMYPIDAAVFEASYEPVEATDAD